MAKLPKKLEYDQTRKLLGSDDNEVRRALAQRRDAPPEALYFLAEDPDAEVRRGVAENESTPRQADVLLSRDKDDEVRSVLAEKLARVTPDLPEEKRATLYMLTCEALEALADDQMTKVRRILSDALKDVANAPASVIRQLARDRELEVCEPVLKFSPVLTDKDILKIIASDPVQGALSAISQRPSLDASVSSAIVEKEDEEAITHLLQNPGADIDETAMDRILDMAPEVEPWHAPLVGRPTLSAKAATRLASFVAMNLLDRLQKRLDLDDDTLVALTQAVEERIAAENEEEGGEVDEEGNDALEKARRLHRTGALTADLLEEALSEGDRRFVLAALSVLSDIDLDIVTSTLNKQRPQRVTAIVWKAGLSAHLALQLQLQFSRIKIGQAIKPTSDGAFSMSDQEMTKVLDFLSGD